MSDQALEQSPQEKLMAMLDEVPEEQDAVEAIEEQLDEQDEQEVEAAESEGDESSEDEELETDDEAIEEDSDEQPISVVKLKVNGEELEKPLDEVIALAQQGVDYTKKTQEVA